MLFIQLKVQKKSHLWWLYTSENYRNAYSAGKESACNKGGPGSMPGRKTRRRRNRPPTPALLGFPGGSDHEESACNAGDRGSLPGSGRSPGGGKGTHSSVLAWRIPQAEEPGGLQATGLQRVGHGLETTPQRQKRGSLL